MRLVWLASEEGRGYAEMQRIADQLGYGVESVHQWAKQADIDAASGPACRSRTVTGDARWKPEMCELRQVNWILEAAASFFEAELDRRSPQTARRPVFCRTPPTAGSATSRCKRWRPIQALPIGRRTTSHRSPVPCGAQPSAPPRRNGYFGTPPVDASATPSFGFAGSTTPLRRRALLGRSPPRQRRLRELDR